MSFLKEEKIPTQETLKIYKIAEKAAEKAAKEAYEKTKEEDKK